MPQKQVQQLHPQLLLCILPQLLDGEIRIPENSSTLPTQQHHIHTQRRHGLGEFLGWKNWPPKVFVCISNCCGYLKDLVYFAHDLSCVWKKDTKRTHEAAIRNLLFQESSRSSHEGVNEHRLQTMITGFTRQLAPISFIKRLRTGIIQAYLGLVSLCPHRWCVQVFLFQHLLYPNPLET